MTIHPCLMFWITRHKWSWVHSRSRPYICSGYWLPRQLQWQRSLLQILSLCCYMFFVEKRSKFWLPVHATSFRLPHLPPSILITEEKSVKRSGESNVQKWLLRLSSFLLSSQLEPLPLHPFLLNFWMMIPLLFLLLMVILCLSDSRPRFSSKLISFDRLIVSSVFVINLRPCRRHSSVLQGQVWRPLTVIQYVYDYVKHEQKHTEWTRFSSPFLKVTPSLHARMHWEGNQLV